MKTCEECKWYGKGSWIHQTSKCKRHVPIVIPNPKYEKSIDEQIALTMWPLAVGPCGDFEEKIDTESEVE